MGLNVIQPTNYGQREAEIKQRLLLAKILNQIAQDNTPSPNQMVGNKVVPLSPFTAIANALSKGVASYQGARAQTEQGQLDDEKRNYLVKALSGGQQITPEIIANAGGSVDDLTKAAVARIGLRDSFQQFVDNEGNLKLVNVNQGTLGEPKDAQGNPITIKSAIYDPVAVNSRSQGKNAVQPMKTTDEQGREIITTPGQWNPNAYGQFGQQTQPVQPQLQATKPTIENPEQALLMQSIDAVMGPGAHQKVFNGGELSLTPQQEAAVNKVFTGLKNSQQWQTNQPRHGMSLEETNALKTQQAVDESNALIGSKLALKEGESKIEVNQAGGKKMAEAEAAAKVDYPAAMDGARRVIQLVDELNAHPGKEKSLGYWSIAHLGDIPGTEQKGFQTRLKQIAGQEFLAAFEQLRGGGQITEIEGQKATEAMARLTNAQSQSDFDAAMRDLKSETIRLAKLAAQRANLPYSGPVINDELEELRGKYAN